MFRQQLLVSSIRPRIHAYLGGIVHERGGKPLQIGDIEDHVHLLFSLCTTKAIADVVRDVKAFSSKWINETKLMDSRFEWQTGYAAFTVSQSQMERVFHYVANQEVHHADKDFAAEYEELLVKHGVEYDPRYLFD